MTRIGLGENEILVSFSVEINKLNGASHKYSFIAHPDPTNPYFKYLSNVFTFELYLLKIVSFLYLILTP
jgi:hypothetical protein